MKRLSKMINGRSSSSKTCHFNHQQSAAEQAESEKITTEKLKFASLHEEEDVEDDHKAAHRLSQNPRKIGKVSTISKNAASKHQQKFVCNKCGKAFQSSKAMCGHMACHSEKEKPPSNSVAKKKVLMVSDTEFGAGHFSRRSRRARCTKNDYIADTKVAANICSSEASGIEQEQEEVAICLMMLSRDSANWSGLNSIGESSDNNSIVLEDKSVGTRLGNKDRVSSGYDLNEYAKEKYSMKKIKSLCDFDAEYATNGVKNVVKIRNFGMNILDEELKSEPHLSLQKLKSLMHGDGYSQIQRNRMESYSGEGALSESYVVDLCKRVEHMSPQPFKQFTAASPLEADAYHCKRKGKDILDDISGNVDGDWKKGKYESPEYSKEFGSGKSIACQCRVHLAEGLEAEVHTNFKRNGIRTRGLIDLNLPAPMEDEEANESMGSH